MKWLISALIWLGEKAFHIAFDYIDKDNDGKISQEEIEELLKKVEGMYVRLFLNKKEE